MSGTGAGMLEANPGALAVVILFFLVFTLGFEALLHRLRAYLMRRKKLGLLAALNKFCSEIMLLGLAILLLTVVEDHITTTCVQVNPATDATGSGGGVLKPWLSRVTGTAEVSGCACCLAKTKGVSHCFMESKGCPSNAAELCSDPGFNLLKGIKHESKVLTPEHTAAAAAAAGNASHTAGAAAAHGNATTHKAPAAAAAASPHRRRRRLAAAAAEGEGGAATCHAAELQCVGVHQKTYPECDNEPGWAPIVTVPTLHQVHFLLFFMAVTHIIIGAVVLLISSTKLKYYAVRGGREAEDSLSAAAIAAAQAEADSKSAAAAAAFGGSGAPDPFSSKPLEEHGQQQQQQQQQLDDAVRQSDGTETPSAFATVAAAATAAAAAADGFGGEEVVLAASPLAAEPWAGRPVKMTWKAWVTEVLVYFMRQVTLWRTVSKQEYSVLRACFYYTHAHTLSEAAAAAAGHKHSHDGSDSDTHQQQQQQQQHASDHTGLLRPEQAAGAYRPYITEQVERDGADVVGLGLSMWLLLLVFVLVSGFIGWATWVFLIFAGLLLFFLNLVLLTSLRHMTMGGRVLRQQESWYHWLHRSNFLLGCIKLALFFFTFVISNAIFMASYFGTESCFFSRTGFQNAPVPWWAIMLVDVGLLLNLALFTLPLYSLTYHTLVVDRSLLQSIVRDLQHQQASAAAAAAADGSGLKSSSFGLNSGHSGGGSGGGGGGGASGGAELLETRCSRLAWAATALSTSFRSSSSRGGTPAGSFNRLSSGSFRRSGSSNSSNRRGAEGSQVQLSDKRRWQEVQEASAV